MFGTRVWVCFYTSTYTCPAQESTYTCPAQTSTNTFLAKSADQLNWSYSEQLAHFKFPLKDLTTLKYKTTNKITESCIQATVDTILISLKRFDNTKIYKTTNKMTELTKPN